MFSVFEWIMSKMIQWLAQRKWLVSSLNKCFWMNDWMVQWLIHICNYMFKSLWSKQNGNETFLQKITRKIFNWMKKILGFALQLWLCGAIHVPSTHKYNVSYMLWTHHLFPFLKEIVLNESHEQMIWWFWSPIRHVKKNHWISPWLTHRLTVCLDYI